MVLTKKLVFAVASIYNQSSLFEAREAALSGVSQRVGVGAGMEGRAHVHESSPFVRCVRSDICLKIFPCQKFLKVNYV